MALVGVPAKLITGLVLACVVATHGLVAVAQAPLPISFGGPFTLIDHNGTQRTERDYLGRYLLVSFGYTNCPDICPTGLAEMARAIDLLGAAGTRVQPLFITVDPARDTPARLKEYVAAFHPRLIGLTGSEAQVAAAARAYRVHRAKVVLPDAAPGDYLATHGSIIYLMDEAGKFVTLFPHGAEAETMAETIRRYLN